MEHMTQMHQELKNQLCPWYINNLSQLAHLSMNGSKNYQSHIKSRSYLMSNFLFKETEWK